MVVWGSKSIDRRAVFVCVPGMATAAAVTPTPTRCLCCVSDKSAHTIKCVARSPLCSLTNRSPACHRIQSFSMTLIKCCLHSRRLLIRI